MAAKKILSALTLGRIRSLLILNKD